MNLLNDTRFREEKAGEMHCFCLMHPVGLEAMIHTSVDHEILNRSPPAKNGGSLPDSLAADETESAEPLAAGGIYCRQCLELISRQDHRIEVQGAHRHTFANPHGVIFEIGCFLSAEGCLTSGPSTRDFSWFKGFSWQVAVCRGCLLQMGWLFSSAGAEAFYALILNRLLFPGGNS